MVLLAMDVAALVLVADFGAQDPVVVEDLVHLRALVRVDLQHASDDMSAFARENAE